jgi:NAD+ dependent glucose-6-phosphate dehydrogenase
LGDDESKISDMRVLITGAAGQIGSQVVDELAQSHELYLIDRRPVKGRASLVADLSRRPPKGRVERSLSSKSRRWSDTFEGAQVVVHLAANPRPDAPWEEILTNNIQATWNVLEAAANHHVRRVIFASSNWGVRAIEQELAPVCYLPDGPKIGSDSPPRPLTAYGMSKALGETTGKMFVDENLLESFVAVRIGHYSPDPFVKGRSRDIWIGADDLRSLFRRCVEAEFKGYHVVYGVSAQRTSPYDLSYTREFLRWEPCRSNELSSGSNG